MLWQHSFAHFLNVRLQTANTLVLALAVWCVYTADRLLDVSTGRDVRPTARHNYTRGHSASLTVALVCAFAAAGIGCLELPVNVLESGLVFTALVLLYFVVVHFGFPTLLRRFPKELLTGVLFGGGTALAPYAESNGPLELMWPALFFSGLCILNCVAIEAWERSRQTSAAQVEDSADKLPVSTKWLSTHLRTLLCAATAIAFFLLLATGISICSCALLGASAAFAWLSFHQESFESDTVRLLADAPLLCPLVFLALK